MNEVDKGNIGVSLVTADLITRGFEILLPVSASSPYDMAIHKANKFYKVQVKYRENHRGYIDFELRRSNSSGKRRNHRRMLQNEVDLYAIFCPDTGKVYYINPKEVEGKLVVRLRLNTPTKFRLTKSVRYAKDYLNLDFLDT